MEFPPPNFARQLREFVHGYHGSRQRAIQHAGDVFEFYVRLFMDPRPSRDACRIINAVLAYFVVPDDVLPDTLGPLGVLDDLYMAAFAYRTLRRELPGDVIADAWVSDENIDDVMGIVYSESRAELGKRAKDIVKMAGLS